LNTRSAKALLGVELGSERHQQPERLRDGGAVFLAVVVGDDLLIAPVVAHRERIRRHHVGEGAFDDLPDVVPHVGLAPDLGGKLLAQLSAVDLAQIEGDGVAMSLRRAAKASAAGSGTSALKRLITVRAIPSKRCWLSSHVRRRRGRWPA